MYIKLTLWSLFPWKSIGKLLISRAVWQCELATFHFSAIPRKLLHVFHRWTSASSSLGSWCSINLWHRNSANSLHYRKLCKNFALQKKEPLPSHLAKIWGLLTLLLGARNVRESVLISPTGKGEVGREAMLWPLFLSKSVFIPQTESPNGQGDSPGPQALAEGDYRETFTLMNTDVNHLLKVTPRRRLCLLPKGPRWGIWHAALFLVFGQEQIWGQLINLSASD